MPGQSFNELLENVHLRLKDPAPQMNFDVIVIGMGSMGSSACYYLAKQGFKVLGLEQFDIPHSYGSHTGQSRLIRKAYGEDTRYVPLLQKAYKNWKELEEETGEQVYFQTGLAYFGSRENPFFETIRQSAQDYDIQLNQLTSEESKKQFPQFNLPDGHQKLFEPDAGFLTSERCILLYIRQALSKGAVIRTNEKVTDWRYAQGMVNVKTTAGNYSAKKLIITTGAWAGKTVPEWSDLFRVTRQVLAWVEPKNPESFRLGSLPCWYMEENGFDFYGFPMLEQEIFGGPAGLKVALHYPGMKVSDPDQVDRHTGSSDEKVLIDFLEKYLPGSYSRTVELKTCLYTYSPDENFVIDHLPGFDGNVIFSGGFSGHGFKFASAVGELLAEMAESGKTSPAAAFLAGNRFK
ncbi:N-methyl-L-tryptophan oxidase [Fulvivirga sedimenti]|uniref:N-methyl-L-tryptophan oxidase n=1 Tax=Fulvivirga sedimenti TaxID=2879465 RepID=A0A9X1HMS9_9BACT|nr:N-methyl-L-tryptophan oxidase [Fulvivirga sedimenti]MCA6075084.1 N-methyl-L-tryptophan oxidase [Fulvivirga sedimenti]MCA6076261.1 N-methyl-L-tryptophan oxidase [Fulvivirga sedimenti]MCA6077389.1 N-methyl-L-tryptophan oxidase [Fulvivirga sedimenti]